MSIRPLLLSALVALAACGGSPSATRDTAVPADTPPAPSAGAYDGVSIDDLAATWRDQRGDTVRFADISAPVRVVAFVYTSCEATCPLIVGGLKRIESSVPAARRADVRFVLVSLDPARDTPGRLAEWAVRTRLDAARWTLLNGPDGAVRELAAVLGVRYQAQAGGEIAHSNLVAVVDSDGAVAHRQATLGETQETQAAVAALLR